MTNHIPNDLSHLSDAEFHSLCPQGEHAPGPGPLSPAAQAILTAVTQRQYSCDPIDVPEATGRIKYEAAAALRAAAEKIEDLYCESDVDSADGVVFALRQLVLIADELEAQ